MDHEVWVVDDAEAVAATAADFVAEQVRAAVAERGRFDVAVSGGRSPVAMFRRLAAEDLPWPAVSIWQVDERIAPAGDADRNLVDLLDAIGDVGATVHPMPVEELLHAVDDGTIDAVCASYAATLPDRFDLIHLGIGTDGHTASLVPGDAVLGTTDRAIAVTSSTYQGRRRMTMTYPTLGRTEQLLWLILGADKREALAGMLAGDPIYPAALVEAPRSVVVADRAADPPVH